MTMTTKHFAILLCKLCCFTLLRVSVADLIDEDLAALSEMVEGLDQEDMHHMHQNGHAKHHVPRNVHDRDIFEDDMAWLDDRIEYMRKRIENTDMRHGDGFGSRSDSFKSGSSDESDSRGRDDDHAESQTQRPVYSTRRHQQLFVEAAESNNLRRVREMVEQRFVDPLTAEDSEGWKALHAASSEGALNVVRYLVDSVHAPINERDMDGATPFLLAAWHGELDVVQFLHSRGADIHARCNHGWSALMGAVRFGEIETVRFLHSIGIDIDHTEKEGQWTPLMVAAALGETLMVEFLLEEGAHVHHTDQRGNTALTLARRSGHKLIVDMLEKQLEKEQAFAQANNRRASAPRPTKRSSHDEL